MKKLFSESRYRKYNLTRSRQSLKARQRFKQYTNLKNRRLLGAKKPKTEKLPTLRSDYFFPSYFAPVAEDPYRDYLQVHAPGDFRLLDNPEGVIDFFQQLNICFEQSQQVMVRLEDLEKIDISAIAVLYSLMVRFKATGIKFNGTNPNDLYCDHILRRSGFLRSLYDRFADTDSYKIAKGSLITYAEKDVVADVTGMVLENAAVRIWGEPRRCNDVQTNLIELAQNTQEHAAPGEDEGQHWWLSVYPEDDQNIVRFSFVDYGIGIFNSLRSKPAENKWFGVLERLRERRKYGNNAQLLKLILQGELHRTVTGEYYRGQGLPGLLDSMDDNWIRNLFVISNDAFADVANDRYVKLNHNFEGTFVYWEINPNCQTLPPLP